MHLRNIYSSAPLHQPLHQSESHNPQGGVGLGNNTSLNGNVRAGVARLFVAPAMNFLEGEEQCAQPQLATPFLSSLSSDTACHSLRLITLYPSNSLACQVRGYRLAHQSSVDYPSRAASLEKRAPRHARPVAAADAPSRR